MTKRDDEHSPRWAWVWIAISLSIYVGIFYGFRFYSWATGKPAP